MQSIFDERLWLAWLVKVRIIILTLLLGIELAIARLTPNPFPLRLFISVISAVVRGFGLLPASAVFLGRTPHPVAAASHHRPVDGHAGGLCHRRRGQFAELLLSAGHHRRLHPAAADWAYLTGALAFILYVAVLELTYFEVIPSYSTTHPGLGRSAGHHLRQSVRLPGGRLPGGIAGGEVAAGGRKAEAHAAGRWKICRRCTKISFSPSAAG